MTNRQFIETFVTLCEGYGIGPWEVFYSEIEEDWNAQYYDKPNVPKFHLFCDDQEGPLDHSLHVWGKDFGHHDLDSPQAYADKVREILNHPIEGDK